VGNADLLLTEGRRCVSRHVAVVLRDARIRRGWSVRQAAAAASLSAGYLSRLERGLRCPRRPTAVALIRAYGLTPDLANELLREAVA
jgi:transcriptional regulator with XRE-family HTH domain